MHENQPGSIKAHFSNITDLRDLNKRHKLIDIITIAICAVVCGADSWEHIEDFGHSKYDWFKDFLELPHGIPSHDTFGRVFARIDPVEFQQSFMNWVQAICQLSQEQIIAVDGKTLRRSHDKKNGKAAIHMVSAWASANGIVLGQIKTDEKSNEITAIPELIKSLEIEGCIVVNKDQEVYQNQGFKSIPGRHWHVVVRDRTFSKTRISVKRLFTKSLFMLQM